MITHHERYNSRSYPADAKVVQAWLDLLPADDVKGLDIAICDATMYNGGLKIAGQYIGSQARRIRSNDPYGLARLFTVPCRIRKDGITFYCGISSFYSGDAREMGHLYEWLFSVLAHEVGHYVSHRTLGRGARPGPMEEARAGAYETAMFMKHGAEAVQIGIRYWYERRQHAAQGPLGVSLAQSSQGGVRAAE